MDKKNAIVPVLSHSEEEEKEMPVQTHPRERKFASLLGFWFVILIVIGAVIVIVVSSLVGYWIHNVQVPTSITINNPVAAAPITTLKIGRTAPYAGLTMTVVNAQYATSFNDDLIHSGTGIIRLNMLIANHTSSQISVVYYTIARLFVPGQATLTPTNVQLSVGLAPGKSETGWIDFAVSHTSPLNTLTLQLGSAPTGELLVRMPFSGSFNDAQYSDRVLKPGSEFDYTYTPYQQYTPYTLNYHLSSLEIREAYQGNQCRVGKRYYIFNFRVENHNSVDVSPGFGYDYMRMVVGPDGNPPVDNTLPSVFKAGKVTSGRVVFMVSAGVHNFSLRFLYQTSVGQEDYALSI